MHKRQPTKYDPADDRHCLGDGSDAEKSEYDSMPFAYTEYGMRYLPPDSMVAEGNDSLKKRRPKADMSPENGGGSLEYGQSFRVKMAGQATDPDMEDY
jgi:hypothetical protein